MRKIVIIIICMLIVCLISYELNLFCAGELQADEIYIKVNSILIENCDSEYYNKIVGLFSPELSNRQKKELINNYSYYKDICVYYTFENRSDTIMMKDVRIEPILSDELKEHTLFYNTGNGTYYINLEPNQVSGMTQHIILKSDEMSNDDILGMLLKQTIEITYFTGDGYLTINTGNGLKGIGKHSYKFKIEDVIHMYDLNSSVYDQT